MLYHLPDIEREEIKKAYNENRFKLENDHLKTRAFVFSSFPAINYFGFSLGNAKGYIYSDICARYLRYKGYNVLNTLGYNNATSDVKELANYLGETSTEFIEKGFESYKNQFKALDLGYDTSREMNFLSNEYLYYIQTVFKFLYEKDVIVKNKEKVYRKNNQILEDYESNIDATFSKLDIYKINLEDYEELIISEIRKSEYKKELFELLNFHKRYIISLNTSNDKTIEMGLDDPLYVSGLAFITINPDKLDITNYIDNSEVSIEDITDDDNLFLYSGIFAVNPITEEEIPVFISRYFDEPFHFGYPQANDIDEGFASYMGISYNPIIDYVDDVMVLINSNKYNGIPAEEARIQIIDDLSIDEIIKGYDTIDLKKLVVSTNEKNGCPVPYHLDLSIANLPVTYDFKHNLRFENGELPEHKLDNLFISDKFLNALSLFAVKMKNEIGINDINNSDELKEATSFKDCSYMMLNNLNELVWIIALNVVIGSLYPDLKININHVEIASPVLDEEGRLMERESNNLISLESLLKADGATIIRLFYLLNGNCKDSYNYDSNIMVDSRNMAEKIVRVFSLPMTENGKTLQFQYKELVKNVTNKLDSYDYKSYLLLIDAFLDEVLEKKDLSRHQSQGLLVLLSLATPSLASRIYRDIFNAKEPLDYLCWPE